MDRQVAKLSDKTYVFLKEHGFIEGGLKFVSGKPGFFYSIAPVHPKGGPPGRLGNSGFVPKGDFAKRPSSIRRRKLFNLIYDGALAHTRVSQTLQVYTGLVDSPRFERTCQYSSSGCQRA